MKFYISNSARITPVLHIQNFLCCCWWSQGWGSSYVFVKVMMQPLINFYPLSLPPFFSYSSSITQQLFLVVNGILSSAYHDTSCPIPILKWLFQVSLCYSCSYHNSACVIFFLEASWRTSWICSINNFKIRYYFLSWVLICSPIWSTLVVTRGETIENLFSTLWVNAKLHVHVHLCYCTETGHCKWGKVLWATSWANANLISFPFTLKKTTHAAVCIYFLHI